MHSNRGCVVIRNRGSALKERGDASEEFSKQGETTASKRQSSVHRRRTTNPQVRRNYFGDNSKQLDEGSMPSRSPRRWRSGRLGSSACTRRTLLPSPSSPGSVSSRGQRCCVDCVSLSVSSSSLLLEDRHLVAQYFVVKWMAGKKKFRRCSDDVINKEATWARITCSPCVLFCVLANNGNLSKM